MGGSSTRSKKLPDRPASAYRVPISDQQQVLPVDRRLLRAVVQRTLTAEQIRSARISLALVNNTTIHRINRDFLRHDYATDVLSFPLESLPPKKPHRAAADFPRAGYHLEGELVLSTEMAQQTAALYGWHVGDELLLYVVHGLLHLCGYDDHSAADLRRMRERERVLLAHWELVPQYRRRSPAARRSPRTEPGR